MKATIVARALRACVNAVSSLNYRLAVKEVAAEFGAVGKNLVFDPTRSDFPTRGTTFIGDDCFFNVGMLVSGNVRFGNRILVGPNVSIMSGSHLFAIPGRSIRYLRFSMDNPEFIRKITVEDEVWLGARSIVVGEVTVGMGAVVGAGAVVVHDVPPYTLSVGNPARPVRQIFDAEVLGAHLLSLGMSEAEASAVVARREKAVGGQRLPVVNNRRRFPRYYYQGALVADVGASDG